MAASLVLIIPAALRDKANALGVALGQGPGNFSVALSGDGETITHYGLLHQAASADFIGTIKAGQQGVLPDVQWSVFDLTVEDVAAVVSNLVVSVSPDSDAEESISYATPAAHFYDVTNQHELSVANA